MRPTERRSAEAGGLVSIDVAVVKHWVDEVGKLRSRNPDLQRLYFQMVGFHQGLVSQLRHKKDKP